MSDRCDICGPNKKECPTAICAPCALMGCTAQSPEHGHGNRAVPRRPFMHLSDSITIDKDPEIPGRFLIVFMGQFNG